MWVSKLEKNLDLERSSQNPQGHLLQMMGHSGSANRNFLFCQYLKDIISALKSKQV